MRRTELEHVIRAAATVTEDDERTVEGVIARANAAKP